MKVSPEVVISGISGRFPASDSLEELKFNLFAGVEMVTGGDARWPSGKSKCNAGVRGDSSRRA